MNGRNGRYTVRRGGAATGAGCFESRMRTMNPAKLIGLDCCSRAVREASAYSLFVASSYFVKYALRS
jgi:hypothetical protein